MKQFLSEAPSGLVSGGAGITEPFFSSYEEMSRGSSHVLYRARRYGRWYVLKGLLEEFRGNPFYEEWLYKEYSIGVSLDNNNIIRVESLEDDAVVGRCIVMEWIDGSPLDHWMKGKRNAERRRIFDQILNAVDYLHHHGVYHHDIKPSNIIVSSDGRVKLIDFGLSDGPQYATFKQASGTENYASPEQKSGAHADHRADIYSLGRIIVLLFARRYPLAVRRATKDDPNRRPQSVASLRKMLVPVWPAWLLSAAIVALLLSLLLTPSHKRFEVRLASGQTVWMRELSRIPHRSVEVVPPTSDHWAPWPDGMAKPEGDIVIPAQVRHRGVLWNVVSVANCAFKDNARITSVKFPESLNYIGEEAFIGCIGLRDTLVIPPDLQRIGLMAFNDCPSLSSVVWKARNCQGAQHDSILKYSYFYRCTGLASVVIDTGVEQIPVDFLSNVSGLERVEFRGTIHSVTANLAAKSNRLRHLLLPPQVVEIGHGAFYETALDSLILPASLEVVGDYAFAYCDSLRVVVMGANVGRVGNYCFTECSHLREVWLYASTPPDVESTAFFQLPETAVLRVPAQSLEAYRRHQVWGKFITIDSI